MVLIPKLYLVGVIRAPENTTDGIHLTLKGHQAMAALVWRFLGPSLATKPDVNHRPQGGLQGLLSVIN